VSQYRHCNDGLGGPHARGLQAFLRAYAFRYSLTTRQGQRDYYCVMQEKRVPIDVADRLAIFIGAHPAMFWKGW